MRCILFSFLMHCHEDNFGGGEFLEKLSGVCGSLTKALTLFKRKVCDFFKDLTLKSIPVSGGRY